MKCYLITGEIPWKLCFEKDQPHLKKMEAALFELFKEYEPRPGNIDGAYRYPVFELSVPADHEPFQKLLSEFSKIAKETEPPCAIVLREFPTAGEVSRARFTLPGFYERDVDEVSTFELLNPTMVLCQQCHFPSLASIPDPFLVNKSVLKKYDVFEAAAGMLVVRPRVLELLKEAIGGQFDFGNAMVAKSKIKPTGDDRLFWVRPKETIGARIRLLRADRPCPACKRIKPGGWYGSTEDFVNISGPGVVDERIRVTHFGTGTADLALIDNSAIGSFPTLAMSGALMTYLEASGVKGFVPYKKYPVDCVFSAKGEATLNPQPRTFGASVVAKPAAMDARARAAGRQLAASLKDLPWDCSKDGHIYFHLSTSSFVVLDPMTGEEDDEGPYTVKNFKGPGVYRLPVKAIKHARKRGVAVDSASLVFVDNAFFPEFIEQYSWDKSHGPGGEFDLAYHQSIAEAVGTRFGICSPPPHKFKSDFAGDGNYTVDVKAVAPA
jgi:hypothetical protein